MAFYNVNFNTSHVTVYLEERKEKRHLQGNFNTSHVTVYQNRIDYCWHSNYYFNTSHVTVYLQCGFQCGICCLISIHLMLRFILKQHFRKIIFRNFNTSHVTVYLFRSDSPRFASRNFNTSHVTVYLYDGTFEMSIGAFQYISCYGLSNDFKPFLSWHLSSFPLFYVISAFFTSRL